MRPPTKPRPVLNPIHLYRRLLREATYLPPVCRTQIEPHIRLRFRKHSDADRAKREQRLHNGNRDLCRLQMANQGDISRMRRVMLITFGRIGWRRHLLMADLVRPEQPDNASQLQQQLEGKRNNNDTGLSTDWLERWDTEKLLAFGRSQSKQNLRDVPRPKFTNNSLNPKNAVPQSNIWGRSLAPFAARSKEREWWKNFANRILPPLPRGEWELLEKLSTGKAGKEWDLPAKRTPALPLTADIPRDNSWDWGQYALRPTRVIERQRTQVAAYRVGTQNITTLETENNLEFHGRRRHMDIHEFTPRFWRRLYGDVWKLTSVVERVQQPDGPRRWEITWGGVPARLNLAGENSHEFFEGVDSKGRPLERPVTQETHRVVSPHPA